MTPPTSTQQKAAHTEASAETGYFWHPTQGRYVLSEVCHWEDEDTAYVRWLEQGTFGFKSAKKKPENARGEQDEEFEIRARLLTEIFSYEKRIMGRLNSISEKNEKLERHCVLLMNALQASERVISECFHKNITFTGGAISEGTISLQKVKRAREVLCEIRATLRQATA